MKMFLTRLGFGSKMVVTGDITQIDLPRDRSPGLVVVADILEDVEGIDFVRFGGEDVVRHRLVQRIVEAYDEHAERQAPGAAAGRAAGALERRGRSRSRSSARRCAARRREIERLVALALASAGVDDGHVAVEFVERRADRRAQRASTAARTGRPTCCRSRSTGTSAGAGGPRELGDIVICPEHTDDLREAIVHGALHLTGMDHETDDGEMLACSAEILAGELDA